MGAKKEIIELIVAIAAALFLYQIAAIILGTSVPITSVVSDSMEHQSDFNEWWKLNENSYTKYNITRDDFLAFPYHDGLYIGDIVVVMDTEIKKGDIIVYHPKPECFSGLTSSDTIIHRVVSTELFFTKGDNNANADLRGDQNCIVSVEGKAIFMAPLLGYPRLLLFWIARI